MTAVSYDGRVAIVTGGGRGLGEAYCHELARRGAAVVVHDNGTQPDGHGSDPRVAAEVADAIVAAGCRAAACTTDASSEAGGRQAVELAVREFGRLDVVVANAGIIHDQPFEDWPTERFEAQLRNHLLSAFHVVRPALKVMKGAGYGRLVFVSSAAGVFGQPGVVGYATAKTGMLGMMNVAALEGAEHGVKANAVMPMGYTRMADTLLGEAGRTPDARAFLEQMRLDQVAPVVAYLGSEQCQQTRLVLSAARGRVAALQIGVTKGWFSPDAAPTSEGVAENLLTILDTEGMLVPGSIFDEMAHAFSQ